MTTQMIAEQKIQKWGNGLGIRLTAPIARAAHMALGQPIKVEVVEGGLFLRVIGKPKLTLSQKLARFDPVLHGGETMACSRVGAELF